MSLWRRSLAVGGAGVALTLAACGTTVPQTTVLGTSGSRAAAVASGAGSDGLSGGGSGQGDGTGPATSAIPGAAAGSNAVAGSAPVAGNAGGGATAAVVPDSDGGPTARATAATGPGATRGGHATTTARASSTPSASRAPGMAGGAAASYPVGVTATTISVGIAYQKNIDQVNAAAGGGGITSGDLQADAKIVIDDINAHGGLGGRQLVPVYYGYDAESTATFASQDQAACAALTQDAHVFAVMGTGLTAGFEQCIEAAGGIVMGSETMSFNAVDFAQFPDFYDVQQLDVDRLMATLAASLRANGYFTGWNATLGAAATTPAKVGVIAFDRPEFTAGVNNQLVPALAKQGVTVAAGDIIFIPNLNSTADDGPAATAVSNAILQFRSDGVDHVILLDTHGGLTQVFLNGASSQQYYPRYGLESGSGIQALLSDGIVTAQQLAGADELGWIPLLDLPDANDPDSGPYSSDARRQCLALMAAGGQTFTSTNAESIATIYCDELHLLRAGITATSGVPTRASVRSGIEGLGDSFGSASLGASRLATGKHDVVARAYNYVYQSACGCMNYTGTAEAV